MTATFGESPADKSRQTHFHGLVLMPFRNQ
jgi:hypothetical protein